LRFSYLGRLEIPDAVPEVKMTLARPCGSCGHPWLEHRDTVRVPRDHCTGEWPYDEECDCVEFVELGVEAVQSR
jgi:hypothetical protein